MKILIIALPRTGSSTLLKTTSVKYKLKPIFEPFDGTDRVKYNSSMKNVVVKTILGQHPQIENLIKDFDKIILLSRKNLKE